MDGPDGSSGTWTPYANTTDVRGLPLDASQLLGGSMSFYASKSFVDPVGIGRRIYWGWALVPPASTQTLPRVTTYHASLKRLIFTPLPELAALRTAVLYSSPSVVVPAGSPVSLSTGWVAGAGNTSEASLSFVFPPRPATFGLRLSTGGTTPTSSDLLFTFDPVAFTASVAWGAGAEPPSSSYYMPGIDMPGDDLSVTDVEYTDPHLCQAACNATHACKGFTYVVRPPLKGSCCLKSGYPSQRANPTCTSGVKPGGSPPQVGTAIPLLPGDIALDVRVFLDNTFLEVFLMEGRLALTLRLQAPIVDAGMSLFANHSDVTATGVNVWRMGEIWKSTEEVLAQVHLQ